MVSEKKTDIKLILFVLLGFANFAHMFSTGASLEGFLVSSYFMQSDMGLLNVFGIIVMMGEGFSMFMAFISIPYLLKNGFSGITK